jgi:methylmalonyl-CoA carboxyltransferase small subunit
MLLTIFTPDDSSSLLDERNRNVKVEITIDGKSYEAEVEIRDEDEASHAPEFAAYPPLPLAVTPLAAPESGDENACLSPVMGLVIKVNVAPGQKVEANETVMVLEAMKMETLIAAPRAGVVKAVHVAAGDSVKNNQVLVEFE